MKLCAVPLVCPSTASHRTCQFRARSDHVNMNETIESPANCEVRAVIRFLCAEGYKPKFIDEWVMCTLKLSWMTTKLGNVQGLWSRTYWRSWCRRSGKETRVKRWSCSASGSDDSRKWPVCNFCVSDSFPEISRSVLYTITLHIWRETIVLGMFTCSLRTHNWQVRCDAIDGHTRDNAQSFIWFSLWF